MDSARKMMLVDPKLFKQTMREKALSRLDEEIEKTLNDDCTDEEKVVRYLSAIKKHRHYDIAEKHYEEKKPKQDIIADVLRSLPNAQQYKAKRILDHLTQNRDVEVSDEGELIYRQQKLHGSRIADLISDVLEKNGAAKSPLGWQEFAESLKHSKVPRELVTNTTRWTYMHPPQPKPAYDETRRLRKETRQNSREETPTKKAKSKRAQRKSWIEF